MVRVASVCFAMLLAPVPARALFHFWDINEVYSSADGTVQFIEMRALAGSQQNLANFGATIRSTNSLGVNTFTFPTNLPADSLNHTYILGTSNLTSIPGGVVPNYIIPANFIRRPVAGGNAAVIWDSLPSTALCTDLPADGDSALLRSGSSMIVVPTNSPRNFNNQSNAIVPVKFGSAATATTNFVMAFRTATGPNGSAGPNYAIEAKDLVGASNWSTATNVPGDGTTKVVAIPFVPGGDRFFRLRVP